MPETMIVKELIHHIDATYRIIGQRSGRAIQEFSMGGGESLRIAAKFPELFSSVVVWGAGGVREFDHIPKAEESRDVEKPDEKCLPEWPLWARTYPIGRRQAPSICLKRTGTAS